MDIEEKDCRDGPEPFHCFLRPDGCVCLRWHRTLLLHFAQEDVSRILECLDDVLDQPSASFCLGAGKFCACRAADDFCYLVCQGRVVLRLSNEDAVGLQSTLASFRAGLEPHREV